MSRNCAQCGARNVPKRTIATGFETSKKRFECAACGAEGYSTHHTRAGVCGRFGAFFGRPDGDE